MSKPSGPICNLDCKYCFYLEKENLYPKTSRWSMSKEVLETYIRQYKRDALPRYCRECEVRFACNGECPKHRFIRTPDGEDGLNHLCAGYKKFFKHIDPYMKFMTEQFLQERPPASVMDWVRQRELVELGKNSRGRNDPCPCGSGKKYKKCCGIRT